MYAIRECELLRNSDDVKNTYCYNLFSIIACDAFGINRKLFEQNGQEWVDENYSDPVSWIE